jgi:hypothetical protein
MQRINSLYARKPMLFGALVAVLGILVFVAVSHAQPRPARLPGGPWSYCLAAANGPRTAANVNTVANCIYGHPLSAPARRCLIAAGVTTAGIVVGGVIGGAAARAIAGGVVGGSGSACVNTILSG